MTITNVLPSRTTIVRTMAALFLQRTAPFTVLLCAASAHATNGYFSHGYGAKSQGEAGIGVAWPQDGLAAVANPAGTAWVDDRLDAGLTWFAPRRGASIGPASGPTQSFSGDGRRNFLIPDIGYVQRITPQLSAAVAVYGNGGMNTAYDTSPFGTPGRTGVNLEQLFITPSVAYKLDEQNAVGLAINLAYQRFSAQGLGAFAGFSTAPASLTDQGNDHSTGLGLRLGWTGKVAPDLTLGAAWSSKINGRFDKYKGLFANNGEFDIPSNFALGVTWRVHPAWTVAFEAQRINYSQVAAVGNSSSSLLAGVPLGAQDGPGFGWHDVTVSKFGVAYELSPDLSLRAGFSHATQPVPSSETVFNILAPGVVQNHLTFGATWKAPFGGELSGFYARGLKKTVSGEPSPLLRGYKADIHLEENILGLAYGWKL